MNKINLFFEKFKKLETILSVEVNEAESSSIIEKFEHAIIKDKRLKKFKSDLYSLSKIRNLIAHNEQKPFYEITDEAIYTLDTVINLLQNPEIAYGMAAKPIQYRGLDSLVFEGIKLMKEKRFSFLPIVENSKIIGVFSSDVLNHIFSKEKELIFDETLTFNKIRNYIDLKNHLNERFAFIKRDEIKAIIENIFIDSYKGNGQDDRPIGCAFVTQSGKETESILGIITIWDVLN